jgi:hypothetical protein
MATNSYNLDVPIVGYPMQFEATAQPTKASSSSRKEQCNFIPISSNSSGAWVDARTDSSAIRKSGRPKAYD